MLNTITNIDNVLGCRMLPDDYIDLTITSPPYDNLRLYNGFSWDFEGLAKELFRVTKKGGVVVWVVNDSTVNGSETLTSFKQALFFKEIGFNVHDTMIWQKNAIPLTHNRYEQIFEYMFVFSKDKPKTFNPILRETVTKKRILFDTFHRAGQPNEKPKIGKRTNKENCIKGNVWAFSVGGNITTKDKIAFDHPAIFPEKLVADHVKSWSNPNDIILDPFMGSGTTAKVARELGRNYIGFEISQEYCEIAEKRLEQTKNLFNENL